MLDVIREFYYFMKVRKKYWLLPVIIALFLISLLIIFSETSAVAPFIYTVF